jgi:hypothetical protein
MIKGFYTARAEKGKREFWGRIWAHFFGQSPKKPGFAGLRYRSGLCA